MKKYKTLSEEQMNQSKARFNKLLEYSFVNREEDLLLDEEDDEDPNQQPEQPTDVPPSFEPDMNAEQPQGELPPAGGMPEEMPNEVQPEIPNELPSDQQGVGNEVEIDVTDLTSKQEDIDNKVEKVSTETTEMMKMLADLSDKVQSIIQSTSQEMDSIKDEIVKRNPTKQEVLQKRVVVSNPFSETPEKYWDEKQKEGNYKLADENEDGTKEYQIKAGDLAANPREIYKSFGLSDDEMNQSLSTIFNF